MVSWRLRWALIGVLWACPLQAQTQVFLNGWDRGSGTASSCAGDSADVLTDLGFWQEYGPGLNQVCTATPDLASISTTIYHSGGRALQMHYKDGDGNNGPDFRIVRTGIANLTEVYFRFYVYHSSDWVWIHGKDHKEFITGAGNQSTQTVYFNLRGHPSDYQRARLAVYATNVDGGNGCFLSDTSNNITVGTWNTIEGHIVFGVNGSVEAKVNGTLLTLTREAGSPCVASNLDTGTSMGYWKFDGTYNCFWASSLGCDAGENFEAINTSGSADKYVDDAELCTGNWCSAGSGGNQTRVPFIRR